MNQRTDEELNRIIGSAALWALIALSISGCDSPERAQKVEQEYRAYQMAAFTGWCKLNNVTNLTFQEWDALLGKGLLPAKNDPHADTVTAAEMMIYGAAGSAIMNKLAK